MTTEFWLGYALGILTILAVAVVIHLRSEKAKRRTFEQTIAAIDAKYPTAQTVPTTPRASRLTCPNSDDGHHHWVDVTSLDKPPFSDWICRHCVAIQDVMSLVVTTAKVRIPIPSGELAFESLLPGSTEHATVGDVRYVVHRPPLETAVNPQVSQKVTRKDVH